jgi:hypothetical protein
MAPFDGAIYKSIIVAATLNDYRPIAVVATFVVTPSFMAMPAVVVMTVMPTAVIAMLNDDLVSTCCCRKGQCKSSGCGQYVVKLSHIRLL